MRAHGFICFIVPNTILRTTTYDRIRKYILDHTKINTIVDLGSGIFDEVTASTVVIGLQVCEQSSLRDCNEIEVIFNIVDLEQRRYENLHIIQMQFDRNTSYAFNIYLDPASIQLSRKIESCGGRLGNYCQDIIEGIVAHKQFIKDKPELMTVPLIEGKSIKRYYLKRPVKYILWDKSKIHRPRPDYIWNSNKKLVIQRISGGTNPLTAALDTKKQKTFASVNNILLKKEFETCYQFILALLNSQVLNWYYSNNYSNHSELTVNISKTYLEQLPVPELSDSNDDLILMLIGVVDRILDITKNEDYLQNQQKQAQVKALERDIDRMVYQLYGLTDEEIKIVENETQ